MAVDSIFPTARFIARLLRSRAVRWLAGALFSLASVAFTVGIWPFFKGWVTTRASDTDIEKLDTRLAKLESGHAVDWRRMEAAGADYLKLTHGEQVYWAVQQSQRSKEQLVEAFRRVVMLEAELRYAARARREPGRDARTHVRSEAAKRFKALVTADTPTPPDIAVDEVLDEMGLGSR